MDIPAPVVGILGAGKAGTAIARLSLQAGHDVRLSRAGSIDELRLMIGFVAPGAAPVTPAHAVSSADLVVLALPLARYRELPIAALAGRVVIDAMNYWPAVDGRLPEFEGSLSSSEVIQARLSDSRVVKTLNHVGYAELEEDARPVGDGDRRGMALAGDDAAARALVSRYVDTLGYDPIDLGALGHGRLLQPGTEYFGRSFDSAEVPRPSAAGSASAILNTSIPSGLSRKS